MVCAVPTLYTALSLWYEPIESGRVFAFLEFSKRGKELWNYREGVLGNSMGAERVKCWGRDLVKFNQAD